MTIQDLAGNPILTTTSPMVGFIPAEVLEAPLSLRIYRFLLQSIRDEDQNDGNQFLERFLEGSQDVWAVNDALIRSLPTLWSVTDIADRFLVFLKNIVGWTVELRAVTDPLDSLALRRLIAASVPFWKTRGPEDAIVDILRLTTAARLRVWNWFDFRIVIGEMAMGEEHLGFDPHMISLPGPPNLDEQRFNIRIVDDGNLNKDLVRELVKLTRPSGERVEISYIGFLDLFDVDDDNSQWTDSADPFGFGGPTIPNTVSNGSMKIDSGTTDEAETFVSLVGSDDWTNYVVTWRAKGDDFLCTFYRTGVGDMYAVSVDAVADTILLLKIVGGTPTTLATVDIFTTLGIDIDDDLFYAIRVEAVPESGSTRIRVYFEAEQIIDELDATHVEGSIGIGHDTSGDVTLDEVEMFFNPLQVDEIDINT